METWEMQGLRAVQGYSTPRMDRVLVGERAEEVMEIIGHRAFFKHYRLLFTIELI